jgi:hypothetical protein
MRSEAKVVVHNNASGAVVIEVINISLWLRGESFLLYLGKQSSRVVTAERRIVDSSDKYSAVIGKVDVKLLGAKLANRSG